MNAIGVHASTDYNVLVGNGLMKYTAEHLLQVIKKPCNIAIISDNNVFPIYGETIKKSLMHAGFSVIAYTFPAGERSKNTATYIEILTFLAENKLTRSDAIIALGGGVVGDMAGFAAATYLRGIRYIQMPTTLLAMVDSSVGGKTAIDLPCGKNLVGAFYQPSLVLCDLDTLNTLPASVFYDGCAEIIKYGVLFDADLFAHLASFGASFDREAVISRCITHKRDVVNQDEFDTGARQKLNFGHTVGHSIELQSGYSIPHGQAVAIGMAIVTKATCKDIYADLVAVLKQFHLPFTTDYSAKQLYSSALSDKKRTGDTINLIIPNAIGDCAIVPTAVEALEAIMQEGL